jgi:hypothetical protein
MYRRRHDVTVYPIFVTQPCHETGASTMFVNKCERKRGRECVGGFSE